LDECFGGAVARALGQACVAEFATRAMGDLAGREGRDRLRIADQFGGRLAQAQQGGIVE
jgi:hypothetical protein